MATKITVIGAGSVGAAVTNDIMVQGIASEVVLIDINKEKAFGEALDVYQGVPFCPPATIHSGDYADAAGSDIVIITSGVPRKPGQTRLELAQTNVDILKQITPQIVQAAPDAIYIIVSNPVDILTYVFTRISPSPISSAPARCWIPAVCSRSWRAASASAPKTSTPMSTANTATALSCPGRWP